MKTARDWAHEFNFNQTPGDRDNCGEFHLSDCDDATAAIRAAQTEALKFALVNAAGMGIEDKIAELERETP